MAITNITINAGEMKQIFGMVGVSEPVELSIRISGYCKDNIEKQFICKTTFFVIREGDKLISANSEIGSPEMLYWNFGENGCNFKSDSFYFKDEGMHRFTIHFKNTSKNGDTIIVKKIITHFE